MSYQIPIISTPNQSLSVVINDVSYEITLKLVEGIMEFSLSVNGNKVTDGERCFPNQFVLPYLYMVNGGNFIFKTENEKYPNWEDFGSTCQLLFFSSEEIENAKKNSNN